jgi:hypothetical protein
MLCEIQRTVNVPPGNMFVIACGGEMSAAGSARNDSQMCATSTKKYVTSAENFAWFELSLVPEIEQVYVDRDASGMELHVVEVVDKRDAAVRARIYEREKEIMSAYPHLGFDFHVIARQGRDLADIMQVAGKAGFRR